MIALFHMICHFKMSNMKEIPWDKTYTGLRQRWNEARDPSIQSEPLLELNFANASTDVTKEVKKHNCDSLIEIKEYLAAKKKVPFSYLLSSEVYESTQNLVLSGLAQS